MAPAPILRAPYRGWTSLVSYFDHDSPNFAHDGLVVTTTGAEARPDPAHSGSGFPAYWNSGLRQFLYYDGHNGYDFNLSYRPVYSAAAGKVIFADWEYPAMPDHGYGRMVMIAHPHGYVTLYGHFSHFLVHKGQHVRQGQPIGISGNTGHSTGPHLHFTVFHNCTPVDPYGWNGQGPDPLISYQGESSTYLWQRQPHIANPAPDWPHLRAVPGAPGGAIALLRLPVGSNGTDAFSRALRREAARVVSAVTLAGGTASIDMVRGAVSISGAIPPLQLLSMPNVVSITTSDMIEGEKSDVLQSLAHAGLADRQRRLSLDSSHHWTGRLVRWQGRVLLIGRGLKNQSVTIRLGGGRGGAAQTVHSDPKTGAYALDLGAFSTRQLTALQRSLTQRHHRRVVSAHSTRPRSPAGVAVEGTPRSAPPWSWLLLVAALISLATGMLFWRRPWAPSRHNPPS